MWIIISTIVVVVLILGLVMVIYFLVEKHKVVRELRDNLERYVPIDKINEEIEALKQRFKDEQRRADEQLALLKQHFEDKRIAIENCENEIVRQYKTIEELTEKIDALRMDEELLECGFYEPRYNFDRLIDFERKIKENLGEQKYLLTTRQAITFFSEDFPFDGSTSKINSFTKKLTNVIVQAFNAECDEAALKVNYKNIVQYETKIEKLFESLNKRFLMYGIRMEEDYLGLKIEQLGLVHEYQEKQEEEKEEQRRIKEIMREQLREEREIEKARESAERDEKRCLEALAQARAKVDTLSEEKQQVMLLKIEELTIKLHEAQEKREKAISMAQLTKAGYVYVISNIGSFGENVFKIGMTRRLEPMDRVKELGDASVPFSFDVHAMAYSANAPELENNLHKSLKNYQLNKVNSRKEFFKVDIDTIEAAAEEFHSDLKLTKLAEAKEFYQTQAINKQE
jgi:HAMP domain-containing protein